MLDAELKAKMLRLWEELPHNRVVFASPEFWQAFERQTMSPGQLMFREIEDRINGEQRIK